MSLVHLSLSYMAIGDLEQADELLTKALLLQPGSLLASDAHGQLLLAKGKLAAARQHYQQQVRVLPTNVRYQQGLLQSLFMLNNTEQLENAALNLIHQQNVVLQDLGHFYLALLSSSHANQDDLALKLSQQLEGGSESAVLSWKVALLNAKLGQKERAKRYLSQAIHYGFSDKHKLAYFDTINPKVRSSEWQVFTKEIQAKKAVQRKRLDL
ncbi:hypothetical protein [Parashewanella hymeniacidonis]|uniref:hypothetical protein n=1 Tax=Parashewanella hymeniacidonis TaxID=2807618 RepID=UPI00308456FF